MGKKKLLINMGLVIILIVCMSASVVLTKKDKQRRDKEAKENITLTDIGYETETMYHHYNIDVENYYETEEF